MPGGGTRPGEEVRDGPHNNNRCGGNRGGVTPTAAPLRARSEPEYSGSGLYNPLGRAVSPPCAAFALSGPLQSVTAPVAEVVSQHKGMQHDNPPHGAA